MAYEQLAMEFQKFDILYGLAAPLNRARKLVTMVGHSPISLMLTGEGCCATEVAIRRNVLDQRDLANAVWNWQEPQRYSSFEEIGQTLRSDRYGYAFRRFLKLHARYNVAKQDLQPGPRGRKKAWARLCKAGLEFQTRRGVTVHFVLEGVIDTLSQIAGKAGYGAKGNVTSAELRWVYRHRNIPEVGANVRFWLPEREVPFSEFVSDERWAAYRPKRQPLSWPPEKAALTVLMQEESAVVRVLSAGEHPVF